jgi:tRNA G10  N-methylase Trm11
MNYIAILGRQKELGLAELRSVLGIDQVAQHGPVALMDSLPDIRLLGGTVKIARVLSQAAMVDLDLDRLDTDWASLASSFTDSIDFGVSAYGFGPSLSSGRLAAYGLSGKKMLRAAGKSARFVATSAGSIALSAAQLKYNRIPERGFELVLVAHQGRITTAVTESYQDIDAYSARDQARPGRDARVGMLPPKLAQMLVNLAGGSQIYDPFCGSGVILQEALLMGKSATGSDLSPDMVAASQTNLDWLGSVTPHPLPSWSVTKADARTVRLPHGSYSVATEGYLGPALSETSSADTARKLATEVGSLALDSLSNLYPQLASGAGLAYCLPAWKQKQGFVLPEIVDQITNLGYTHIQFVPGTYPLVYHREGQYVGRAILTLRKN